jgi:hypothetical protein
MTATLVRSYEHPRGLLAGSQGNMQLLLDGHVLVGWGAVPYVTEFTRSGDVVFDARFNKGADSYRAYRFPWVGRPADRPALAATRDGDTVTAYASWNGATAVRSWRLLAGADRLHLRPVTTAARQGFETTLVVTSEAPYVAVEALDATGRALGRSGAQRPR